MKVLIVSYAFAPTYSANAVKWAAIAEALAESGVNVEVVTAWTPGLAREEMAGGIRILRVGGELSTGVRARLRRRWGAHGSRTQSATRTNAPSPVGSILKALNRLWRRVYWPDHACLWIPSAARAVSARLADGVDVVISVAHPFSDHLAALWGGAARGGVCWIADYGDPFALLEDTPTNNHRLYGKLNRRADALVMNECSRVTVPNAELIDLYVASGIALRDRFALSSHVALRSAESYAEVQERDPTAEISFCYAGAFARGVRSPKFFFECGRAIVREGERLGHRVTIHVYGSLNDCADDVEPIADLILKGAIRLHGEVPPGVARQAIDSADVLVNVGNETAYRQPSKLVEYMSTGKPIINFATTKADSSISMLEGYVAAVTILRDVDAPGEVGARAIGMAVAPRRLQAGELEQIREKFSPRAVAQRFLDIAAAADGAAGQSREKVKQ